ncbi:hypothetical protein SAMN04487905_103366 [Actinopolyspora xinjiangensis]|uniref:Uncharacterized protein n=1 Tax=Actinopolyspora xinjiangensis TaxID=405564 RepID=A0A1H0S504_9ACTN|nr:hypothetical protein [Actinopolyspora xinjiangensis]SDP36326.1 hypothetical protein SAMN04487905_103366 [Actinopolyspora xinjiangensis]
MSKRLPILISTIAAFVLSVGLAPAIAEASALRGSTASDHPASTTSATAPRDADELTMKVRKAAPGKWCVRGYYKNIYRGTGCFRNKGDHVTAYDGYKDGMHIRTDWHTDYGRDGACADGGDAGRDDCNYNMRESGSLKFQVELRDKKELIAQTQWTGYLPIGQ